MPRINKYYQPETLAATHRPPGSPQPRESKPQKAQLKSEHKHDKNNAVKRGMSAKIGREEIYNQ